MTASNTDAEAASPTDADSCANNVTVNKPKRLRWSMWHTPARIVRRAGRDIIRIIDGWPTTGDLLDVHQRITALC